MPKLNCWEFKKCGREPGGSRALELGVCPASTEELFDGVNGGACGGRACWALAGTFCGGKVQGTFANKFASCLLCDFYRQVLLEDGRDHASTKALLEKRQGLGKRQGPAGPHDTAEGQLGELVTGLSEIFDVLLRVSEGDYSPRLETENPNPLLAALAKTVNDSVGAVRDSYEELREANEKLHQIQETILSLSTPVVEIWEGVLALPLIGVLDSQRAQQAMEVLLEKTVRERAKVVIVDITGVPLVDSLVASHLVQMLAAIQLIGARGVLTGLSSGIAQTLVKLGVNVGSLVTRRTISDGLQWAMDKMGIEPGQRK